MADAEPGASACPNCRADAPGDYCPACGQSQQVETPTLWEAVHDVVDDLVAVDARLPRTLKRLILRPGALTEDWLEGRRARYIRPVRLYLFCSLLFFAGAIALPEVHQPADSAVRKAVQEMARGWMEGATGGSITPGGRGHLFLQAQGEVARTVGPQVLFLMMPVFALLVMGFYRKADCSYIDHLVFSAHVHSFAFLWLALQWTLVNSLPLGGLWVDVPFYLLLGWLVAYLIVALRRVYGQPYLWSSLKGAFALSLHGLLLMIGLFAGTLLYAKGGGGPGAELSEAHEGYWTVRERLERGDTAAAHALVPETIVSFRRVEAHLYDPQVRYHLGWLLLETDQPDEALEVAREGLVEDSTHLLALALAGRAAEELGQEERARKYYGRFLEAYDAEIEGYRESGSRHVPDLRATRERALELGLVPPDSAEG